MVYCCEEKESKCKGVFYPRPLFILYWEADIMPLFDNENRILQIEAEKEEIFQHLENPTDQSAVYGRFCQEIFMEYECN